MKASITFSELQKIAAEKVKKGDLSFSKVDDKTIRLIYKVLCLPVRVELRFEGVSNSDLFLSYDGGFGVSKVIEGLLSIIQGNPQFSFVEKSDNNKLIVHLARVEKAKAVLDKIDIHGIVVLDDALQVDGSLKL